MFSRMMCCVILALGALAQEPMTSSGSTSATPFQISGVLVDEINGQPIRHARVAITPVTKPDAYTTIITQESGQFVFPNLTPGKYRLSAQKRGYLTRSFNQHDGFSSAIMVGADQNSSNLLFKLPRESVISGVVSDEAGEPVRNAQILVYTAGLVQGEQGPYFHYRGTTDEEGSYRCGHLSPGKYLVAVIGSPWYAQRLAPMQAQRVISSDGMRLVSPAAHAGDENNQNRSPLDVAYPVTYYPGVTEAAAATPIVIRSSAHFVADISLQPVPASHIRLSPDALNKENSFIQVWSRPFDAAAAHVTSERRFVSLGDMELVGLAPGHYELEFRDGQSGNRGPAKWVEVDAVDSGEVRMDQATPSVDVTAALKLDAATTAPLEGTLRLFNSRMQESINEQVSSAGEIVFKQRIRPGKYELTLINNSGEFIKTIAASGASVSGRVVEVNGQGPVKLTLTIARGAAEVNGVALRNDKPLAGVMIVLVPSDMAHNRILVRRDQSDSDGTFTLRAVVPGRYTLLALENGWKMEWQNPDVLKPYLAAGEIIDVQQNANYTVKARVQ